MRLLHCTAALALAVVTTTAYAPLGTSRAAPDSYRVGIRNATGTDITVEYCSSNPECHRLGELKTGATRTYSIPASALDARTFNHVVFYGKVSLGPGIQQLLASDALNLTAPYSEVTLARRPGSSASR